MASLPASPSMIYPPSLPPSPVGASTQAPVTTASKPVTAEPPKRDENSLNARLFAVLNSIEKSNEESKEAPVPAYVKWGLPFLVTTQVATLALLAFNLREMATLKASQRSIEGIAEKIDKDLLKSKSLQDLLIVGQELLSGEPMSNPDLQPLSNAVTIFKKSTNTKGLVDTATGVVGFVKGVNAFWQFPLCKFARIPFNLVSQTFSYVCKIG
jgi:hypothetical protein